MATFSSVNGVFGYVTKVGSNICPTFLGVVRVRVMAVDHI